METQIAKDLIQTTLASLGRGQLEIMWDSQDHPAIRIYDRDRVVEEGGTSIERRVMLDHSGTARYKSLYAVDKPVQSDQVRRITVPWASADTHYSWDLDEIQRNTGSNEQVLNLVQSRRIERMWALQEMFEERMWRPLESANDTLNPFGVPHYFNFANNGVNTDGAFNGQTIRFQDGSTSTVAAGIDAAIEPKWRNYTAQYSSIDQTLLKSMRRAVRATNFRASPFVEGVRGTGGIRPAGDGNGPIEWYTDLDTLTALEDLADTRDDNNRPRDLANSQLQFRPGDDVVFFNGRPMKHAPSLDGLTVLDGGGAEFAPAPIYQIDWTKMVPYVLRDRWLVESEPMHPSNQHTVLVVYLDLTHQNLCVNRRTGGLVIHKVIPAS